MLVVVSKVKALIRQKEDLQTSADVTKALSDHIESIALQAAVMAKKDGRKTVMRRDIDRVLNNEPGRVDLEG